MRRKKKVKTSKIEKVKASLGLYRDKRGKWRIKRPDILRCNITAFRSAFAKLATRTKKPMRPEDYKFLNLLGKDADSEARISTRYARGEIDRYMLAIHYHRARLAWEEKYPPTILLPSGKQKYNWKTGFRRAFKFGKYPKPPRRKKRNEKKN